MIKPTVGRVVWYYPTGHSPGDQPLAAIIARVWSDTRVNLAVPDEHGSPYRLLTTSVLLVQEGDDVPEGGGYCTWMPYQISQAKAHAEKPF